MPGPPCPDWRLPLSLRTCGVAPALPCAHCSSSAFPSVLGGISRGSSLLNIPHDTEHLSEVAPSSGRRSAACPARAQHSRIPAGQAMLCTRGSAAQPTNTQHTDTNTPTRPVSPRGGHFPCPLESLEQWWLFGNVGRGWAPCWAIQTAFAGDVSQMEPLKMGLSHDGRLGLCHPG